MENINSMLINDIVKDFQHPSFGIEAEQKMFILVIGKINLVFKNPVGKGTANIYLAAIPCLKADLLNSISLYNTFLFYYELDRNTIFRITSRRIKPKRRNAFGS